ncbi:phage major capsid protein [Pseudorhodoferax sp. Leaf267]|uniref:phage major capsid protein n=1 Tax=Pseudorhodoferax sp. Leaf267 TaxID=1736316 RepID=UPI0006FE61E0|nr:phage major capsid protein [Pseudorhodoferax sp. Leaf267]KQP20556.1 hypothetical protein ASF43_27415 [Pseudorhodoferax sp. Leaf267]
MIEGNQEQRGLLALRVLRARAVGHGDPVAAMSFAQAKSHWSGHQKILHYMTGKAAVAPVNSLNAPLISEVGSDLLLALRPITVLGKLGVRRLPLRTRLLTGSHGAVANWMAESRPIPLTLGSFSALSLDGRKIAALMVASNDLLRSDLVDVEQSLLDDLLAACRQVLDMAFLDPQNSGIVDERPASITHPSSGGVLISSTGTSVGALDADLKSAIAALLAAGSDLSRATWVMSQSLHSKLSLVRGSGGVTIYPGLSQRGGLLAGLPWIASQSAPTNIISLIDPQHVGVSEEEPYLSTAKQGAIDMSSAPGEPSMTTPVSLFQSESTALKAVLNVDFVARRPSAATVTGVGL